MKKPDTQVLRQRFTSIKAWELPKQTGSLAPPDVYVRAEQDEAGRSGKKHTKTQTH